MAPVRIDDRFNVNLPIEQAWHLLLDVKRIARCLPGTQLADVEGDEYQGMVKVKLGTMTAQFRGWVRFAQVDEERYRLVLRAEGRETRGQGEAGATVVATMKPARDGGTEVAIDTDLTVTGHLAQVESSVWADVTAKLLAQFARCLGAGLAAGSGSNRGASGSQW
jgi:carbon monoxide dehydrogenase subunit G